MRKYAFSALTAAVVACCITLTGCTAGQSFQDDEPIGLDGISGSDWQVHFSRESGKITAIFDNEDSTRQIYRDDTFDQTADFAMPFFYGNGAYSGYDEIEGNLGIGDKTYPATLTVRWSLESMNWKAQAAYYNSYIASPETIAKLIEPEESGPPSTAFLLTEEVLTFVEGGVVSSGTMPTPQFTTSGKATITYGPDFLVQGYANGVAPEDLVFDLTGSAPDVNRKYAYSFGCAHYEIALANKGEIQSWIDQLPVNGGGVQIDFSYDADDAVVATEAPCDIAVESPLSEHGSNDAVQPPPVDDGYNG